MRRRPRVDWAGTAASCMWWTTGTRGHCSGCGCSRWEALWLWWMGLVLMMGAYLDETMRRGFTAMVAGVT